MLTLSVVKKQARKLIKLIVNVKPPQCLKMKVIGNHIDRTTRNNWNH